jgi:hypothetical protein
MVYFSELGFHCIIWKNHLMAKGFNFSGFKSEGPYEKHGVGIFEPSQHLLKRRRKTMKTYVQMAGRWALRIHSDF